MRAGRPSPLVSGRRKSHETQPCFLDRSVILLLARCGVVWLLWPLLGRVCVCFFLGPNDEVPNIHTIDWSATIPHARTQLTNERTNERTEPTNHRVDHHLCTMESPSVSSSELSSMTNIAEPNTRRRTTVGIPSLSSVLLMVAATATYLSLATVSTSYDGYRHESQFHRRIRAVSSSSSSSLSSSSLSSSYNDGNNNNSSNNNHKPTFYWLIDLPDPELGTSLLQTTLCGSSASSSSGWTERTLTHSSLDDDDDDDDTNPFVYLGICCEDPNNNKKPSQSTVFDYPPDTIRTPTSAMAAEPAEYPFATDFRTRVDALRPTGQSVLFATAESALFTTAQIRQMQELLTTTWDVQIRLVHRPMEEWLLLLHHYYQQQQRQQQLPHNRSDQVLSFLDLEHTEWPSTQLFLQAEEQTKHPVQILQDRYQSQFRQVNLVSLSDLYLAHTTNDSPFQQEKDETALLWEYVVCDFVRDAAKLCDHVRRSRTQQSFSNQNEDQPVRVSSFSGPLGSRVFAAQPNDETILCPSPDVLQRLEQVSRRVDRSVHDGSDQWTQDHATFYHARFQEWVASKRYCHAVLGRERTRPNPVLGAAEEHRTSDA